jgi:glycerate 2-kinase
VSAPLRADARTILDASLAAVEPAAAVRRAVSGSTGQLGVAGAPVPAGGVTLVGAGKAACGMAAGLAGAGIPISRGAVVTRDGYARPVPGVQVREAGHPIPDARGAEAAEEALALVERAGKGEMVVALVSGGASALWTLPPAGVPLQEVQAITDSLLRGGAPIGELNAVRKHLSRISGGRLAAAAYPATLVTLAISDVVGSPPGVIGSGPTVADPTTFADALEVLERRGVDVPPAVRAHLEAGVCGELPETPKPGDPVFDASTYLIVARCADALAAGAERARQLGYRAEVVTDDVEGEAREIGAELGRIARRAVAQDGPTALLLGGETTVTVRGQGTGGRNQEMALAAAREVAGREGVVVACLATDGTDGPTTAGGAIVDGGTIDRVRGAGFDPDAALEANDSHPALDAAGDLLVTGPTGTNVNDVALVLVG